MKNKLLYLFLSVLLFSFCTVLEAQTQKDTTKRVVKKKKVTLRHSSLYDSKKTLPDMVLVEGGTFDMGSTLGHDNESPVHKVTVSSFYIGMFEVTQQQWVEIMGTNPSSRKEDNLPVDNISYDDAQKFIKKLNAKTGKKYRLPTEAEWEYAARGGKLTNGYTYPGTEIYEDAVWCAETASDMTQYVGLLDPNELGLYDMCGNVSEWCSDWYDPEYYSKSPKKDPKGPAKGTQRICRGGSWYELAADCTVSNRIPAFPDKPGTDLGLRLAMDK